jgi:hypothetical protein
MARFKWTDALEFQLLKLLGEGRTYRYIAGKLGCGKTTVKVKAKELQMQSEHLRESVYPLTAIPKRFIRTHPQTIQEWVKRGWLGKPRVSCCRDRKFYRFTREQLEAFLEVQEAWVAWEPDDLIDKDLRQWAKEEREKVGWRWLHSHEAMATIGYHVENASYLISTGALDRSKCVLYGVWWIRSDELERFRATIPNRRPGVPTVAERYGEESFSKSCRLTASQVAFYEDIGGGNCAEGVRRLADSMMKQESKGAA